MTDSAVRRVTVDTAELRHGGQVDGFVDPNGTHYLAPADRYVVVDRKDTLLVVLASIARRGAASKSELFEIRRHLAEIEEVE